MNKPTSVKFPKEMLVDIDNECEGLGCNRTDFIKEAVQEKLDGNSQDQEENSPGPDDNTTPKEELKPKVEKDDIVEGGRLEIKNAVVVNEPKPTITIKDIPEPTVRLIPQVNSNKPPYQMIRETDGKLYPYAKRYDI